MKVNIKVDIYGIVEGQVIAGVNSGIRNFLKNSPSTTGVFTNEKLTNHLVACITNQVMTDLSNVIEFEDND